MVKIKFYFYTEPMRTQKQRTINTFISVIINIKSMSYYYYI